MADWARDYFEQGYAQRWNLPPLSDDVRLEAAGLWQLLELAPSSRIVDIGCGHGRHALALAERGADVIGVDFAVALLDRARHLASDLRLEARWIRGDMRRLPLRSECASAAVVMDAFGFFDTEDENEAVLREAARALRSGGRILLKVVNGRRVLETFRDTGREERNGRVATVSRTLTWGPPRMTERISINDGQDHREYERRQRLYGLDELCAALERAGLSVENAFAGPAGARFEATSPAMWIVARKRGAV